MIVISVKLNFITEFNWKLDMIKFQSNDLNELKIEFLLIQLIKPPIERRLVGITISFNVGTFFVWLPLSSNPNIV